MNILLHSLVIPTRRAIQSTGHLLLGKNPMDLQNNNDKSHRTWYGVFAVNHDMIVVYVRLNQEIKIYTSQQNKLP